MIKTREQWDEYHRDPDLDRWLLFETIEALRVVARAGKEFRDTNDKWIDGEYAGHCYSNLIKGLDTLPDWIFDE